MGEYRLAGRDLGRFEILTPAPVLGHIVHGQFLVLRPQRGCAVCRRPMSNRQMTPCEKCGVFLHRRCYWGQVARMAERVLLEVGTDDETNALITVCQGCRS